MPKFTVDSEMPMKFQYLFEDGWRYKVAHGGRGSAKSHSFAEALVVKGHMKPLEIVCAREFQNSIQDSVKKLLDDKIRKVGLQDFYTSTKTEIIGLNGTRFSFSGLRNNISSFKSREGIDILWIEEAQTVSKSSLTDVIPTVRNPGSEIWATWNPKKKTDPIDVMFRGQKGPPPRSCIVEVNYYDNPWFKDSELVEEMESDKRRDPDKYLHVWKGHYIQNSEAKVFRNYEIRPFETSANVERFYFGADWGYSIDPSVLVRCWIGRWDGDVAVADPTGSCLFIDHEAYKVGCEIDDLPRLFAGRAGAKVEEQAAWSMAHEDKWPGVPGALTWPIIGDSARPETISYMRRHGFHITPAIKGPKSVEEGVEFLRSYDIVVHPRCNHTADELALYSYKIDRITEEVLPVLEDKDNHVIDSLRYAVEKIRRAGGAGFMEFYKKQAELVDQQMPDVAESRWSVPVAAAERDHEAIGDEPVEEQAKPHALQTYVDYIRNTGFEPLPIEMFDEDWAPIGPKLRRELTQSGLVNEKRGGLRIV